MNYEKLYFAFIEKYKNQVFEDGVYTENTISFLAMQEAMIQRKTLSV